MNKSDIDKILDYLSVKFNKIFWDREFVCCVNEDFQIIINNKSKCYVLVFPLLGPVYLEAVRYQAKIFNLAVFSIGCGKLKSIAVCHKDFIKTEIKETMEVTRRKRPERQLYIPPAQRNLKNKNNQEKFDNSSTKDIFSHLFTLKDIVDILYNLNTFIYKINKQDIFLKYNKFYKFDQRFNFTHQYCLFKQILLYKKYHNYNNLISFYNNNYTDNFFQFTITNAKRTKRIHSLPFFDFNIDNILIKEETFTAILIHDEIPILNDFCDKHEENAYKLECDKLCDNLLDLSYLGHYFIMSIDGNDYFHECHQSHDIITCYLNEKTKLEMPNPGVEANKSKINENDLRKTKENRKSRPIVKYVDENNKDNSVNNWEDLFDDEGKIQERLLTEIVDKVGKEVTIVKATEDYSAYTNKSMEDLEHVVELYNFPSSLETHDLVQAFSDINSDAMYVKWVDDTHALLVLGSLHQAQKAIKMGNSLIKVRPMSAASAIAKDVANKTDLKPAMKRPPTNLQTARRLITTHLGTKSKISKEQIAKEKQDLKMAKEMKKLIKKNEVDAWEGNIRSIVN